MSVVRCGALAAVCCFALSGIATAQSAAFDGLYRAPAGGVPGNTACGTTKFGYSIRVAGGVATLQTVTMGQLQGNVGPDGSVTMPGANGGLSGKFSKTHFSGIYNVRSCAFSLEYDK